MSDIFLCLFSVNFTVLNGQYKRTAGYCTTEYYTFFHKITAIYRQRYGIPIFNKHCVAGANPHFFDTVSPQLA